VLVPVVLPVYFAKRNLKAGKVREGGTGWNVIKNFALFWTLTMAVGAIAGMVNAGQVADRATTQAHKAGAALGATLGMGIIFVLWFVALAAVLILGLFLRNQASWNTDRPGRWRRQRRLSKCRKAFRRCGENRVGGEFTPIA
jgi:peptidoglycan biosynthesis protein MviN/MurJ (putative lipid II flippase)